MGILYPFLIYYLKNKSTPINSKIIKPKENKMGWDYCLKRNKPKDDISDLNGLYLIF